MLETTPDTTLWRTALQAANHVPIIALIDDVLKQFERPADATVFEMALDALVNSGRPRFLLIDSENMEVTGFTNDEELAEAQNELGDMSFFVDTQPEVEEATYETLGIPDPDAEDEDDPEVDPEVDPANDDFNYGKIDHD